eukprot:CAMPEP_0202016680 /NCGR_PEP_ID=MMETSP0905-20130828/35045_1 /ASSEMBLY_ACC=CAM_ASM_000554 /TAXON_ID=420261 /ORGANISM="Thalassiosira antarctica, Strain CCMP982" /LENGTH=44 /DNA_ID= /DNA_START= /DNA_END= /DNA_ORIENTATION=
MSMNLLFSDRYAPPAAARWPNQDDGDAVTPRAARVHRIGDGIVP